MVAEFEANLGHLRTREGMALAKKNGKLKGKQPKLPEPARRSIRRRYAGGEVSLADLATEYSVGRSTIHRIIHGPDARTAFRHSTATVCLVRCRHRPTSGKPLAQHKAASIRRPYGRNMENGGLLTLGDQC
ncbi:hypothetical protein SAMN05444920_118102 [Nonomuraea solani]|uniref:Resolvase/invertase-type recombinase catalytic domain-containing protein n=1 Tax=Nonomuraea solani TaxID=1144553 RepID=A0A1H6EU28_9ACTN|nr:recombinase family protein [Nonomuraea solani]SEH00913.1 hypothetical protein SAMN05444920_118102 [Nonomuraea solani]